MVGWRDCCRVRCSRLRREVLISDVLEGLIVSGDLLFELLLIAGAVLGYFKLRQEQTGQIEIVKVSAAAERDKLQSDIEKTTSDNMKENQKLIRETLAAERADNVRKDRANEQLALDNARHQELRAEAEAKAEERRNQNIILERQLGETINKAINEAKNAERERVMREVLEKQNAGLRGRVDELETQVKQIPVMEKEIEVLRQQVETLMAERARKDQEIDQLKAAVNDAA